MPSSRQPSTPSSIEHLFDLPAATTPDVGREEQFERLYLLLVDANAFQSTVTAYEVNDASHSGAHSGGP